MSGWYARYSPVGISGGGGGGNIKSINGDTTAAQIIAGITGISVATVAGTTTISPNGSWFYNDGRLAMTFADGTSSQDAALFDDTSNNTPSLDFSFRALFDVNGDAIADWSNGTSQGFIVNATQGLDVTAGAEIGENLVVAGQGYSALSTTHTPSGTTQTVDWNGGNTQELDLSSATGTVVMTLSNGDAGGFYSLIVVQGSTPRNITFSGVKWPGGTAPTISTGSGAIDILTFVLRGGTYYGQYSQNFS